MPIKYSKCKVYKLVLRDASAEIQDIYVGSTCQPLSKRMVAHRRNAKTRQSNVYKWMRDVGIDNVVIVLISEHPECTSYEDQRRIERHVIEQLQPSLNMRKPYVSAQERCESLREYDSYRREQKREMYFANHETMLEYGRKWRAANQEARRKHYAANRETIREKRRQYYATNRDAILNQRCRYREANKEILAAKQRARYAAKKAAENNTES